MSSRNEPLVSILLPVRNAASSLEGCLESIRRQTLKDWECLIVDDGSSDGTRSIAKSAVGEDPRFRLLSGEQQGLIPALNRGLGECSAEWTARMDGDDFMHRDRLMSQVRCLEENPVLAGVGCHVRMFPRDPLGKGIREYEAWLNRLETPRDVAAAAWIECPLAHPSMMIRTTILVQARYQDHGWPEDYDLFLRLLGEGNSLAVVPHRLLSWRRRNDSLVACDPRYDLNRFTACKAEHLCRDTRIGFLAGSERYLLWGYGGTGRGLANALREHGRSPAGIVELHPGRIGNRIQGAEVFPPEDLPEAGSLPLVVSVAGHDNRERIRFFLLENGWVEGRDYICAA